MKKYFLLILSIVMLAIFGLYYFSTKTSISCGSIPNSPCYNYTCSYGVISPNIGGGADCIGGPKSVRGKEIIK